MSRVMRAFLFFMDVFEYKKSLKKEGKRKNGIY